jgi:hypothetical protein
VRSSGSEATLGTALQKRIGLPQLGHPGLTLPLSSINKPKIRRQKSIDIDQWTESPSEPKLTSTQMPPRRFPPPWSVEEQDARFLVRDHDGHQLAYACFEDEAEKLARVDLRQKHSWAAALGLSGKEP